MNLCVIPARIGSKRIPKKNIRIFIDKPIIEYPIIAALNSKCFDKVIVSTDSQEVVNIVNKYDVEVPFLRPKPISDDSSSTIEVIRHAISWFNDKDIFFNNVCCIYPTAALINPNDIIKSKNILTMENPDFCFSSVKVDGYFERIFTLQNKNIIKKVCDFDGESTTQYFKKIYSDAGQFYWGGSEAWMKHNSIFDCNSIAYLIPPNQTQDIDTIEDWELAEFKYKLLKQ